MASANTVSYATQRISDIENEPCKMLLPIEGYEDFPLLPLDMSVEPLDKTIPNVARNAWISKERTDEIPSNSLTQEESASIHLYTMEWHPSNHSLYFHLNAALRAQDRDLLIPYFGYLKLILSALWKLESIKKVVWRSVKADLSSQYPVGKTFVWWGFSSCTDSLALLESEKLLGNSGTRTLFSIECESGKEIHQHSYFQQGNEILLLPATQFQVIGMMNPALGFYIIHLKETKPQFPLLQPPFNLTMSSTEPVIVNTSDISNNKAPIMPAVPSTVTTKSSQSLTTKLQKSISSSTKTEHNQKLEMLIQQKAILEFVEFRERQLNDQDADLVAGELARNGYWKDLSLTGNNIGAAGAASLRNALLSNSTLQIIRLGFNQLGDEGVACLVSALKVNQTLEYLILDGNRITDIGATQLSSMLQANKSLKIIDLQDNEIRDSGIGAMVAALKLNTKLQQLDLCRNKFTDQCVHAILDLLLHTKTLYTLRLSGNQFSANTNVQLGEAAKQSVTCVHLK